MLVDAETLVSNDQIVRRASIDLQPRLSKTIRSSACRWQADGLHYSRVRALISATRLGEKLKAQNVVIRPVEGDKIAVRIKLEELNEEQAKQMFRKALADFTPDKVLTVTLPEERPAAARGPDGVKVTVPYRVAANFEAWKVIRAKLVPLLEQLSPGKRSGPYLGGQGFYSQTPSPRVTTFSTSSKK